MTNEFEEVMKKDEPTTEFGTDEFNTNEFGTDDFSVDDVEQANLNQQQTQSQDNEEEEIGASNYESYTYIKTPEVGKSIEFTIEKIVHVKDPSKLEAINKTTKEKFHIGVKKKDGTIIRYDVVTDTGERFVLNSWQLFILFNDRKNAFAEAVRKNGKTKGIKVKLTRIYDGSVANEKVSNVMKLYNLDTVEKAEEYKKEVAKALKENKIFKMEILS